MLCKDRVVQKMKNNRKEREPCLTDRRDGLRKSRSSDKGCSSGDRLEVTAGRQKDRKYTEKLLSCPDF